MQTNSEGALSSQAGTLEVLVASDQNLVGDAVRIALEGKHFSVTEIPWKGRSRPLLPLPRRASSRSGRVGLMVCGLDRWSVLYEARMVMASVEVPWVVLTDAAPGPAWGGLLVGGADLVLPGSTSLSEVGDYLDAISTNRSLMPRHQWARLVGAWLDSAEERENNAVRIARLSAGQRQVLELLHLGLPVAEIAARLGVAPSTVRSQVKEILRRLEVGSQLAAVAAFEVDLEGPDRGANRTGMPLRRPPNA